ncbi:hypothetical protein ACVXG7_01790 [Enterobacter hormaechei]
MMLKPTTIESEQAMAMPAMTLTTSSPTTVLNGFSDMWPRLSRHFTPESASFAMR